jgi:hypothetical protein
MEVNSINDPGNEFVKQLIIANSLNFGSPKTALLCIIFDYLSMCLKIFSDELLQFSLSVFERLP